MCVLLSATLQTSASVCRYKVEACRALQVFVAAFAELDKLLSLLNLQVFKAVAAKYKFAMLYKFVALEYKFAELYKRFSPCNTSLQSSASILSLRSTSLQDSTSFNFVPALTSYLSMQNTSLQNSTSFCPRAIQVCRALQVFCRCFRVQALQNSTSFCPRVIQACRALQFKKRKRKKKKRSLQSTILSSRILTATAADTLTPCLAWRTLGVNCSIRSAKRLPIGLALGGVLRTDKFVTRQWTQLCVDCRWSMGHGFCRFSLFKYRDTVQ